jgi:hypothetical protein
MKRILFAVSVLVHVTCMAAAPLQTSTHFSSTAPSAPRYRVQPAIAIPTSVIRDTVGLINKADSSSHQIDLLTTQRNVLGTIVCISAFCALIYCAVRMLPDNDGVDGANREIKQDSQLKTIDMTLKSLEEAVNKVIDERALFRSIGSDDTTKNMNALALAVQNAIKATNQMLPHGFIQKLIDDKLSELKNKITDAFKNLHAQNGQKKQYGDGQNLTLFPAEASGAIKTMCQCVRLDYSENDYALLIKKSLYPPLS